MWHLQDTLGPLLAQAYLSQLTQEIARRQNHDVKVTGMAIRVATKLLVLTVCSRNFSGTPSSAAHTWLVGMSRLAHSSNSGMLVPTRG